MSMTMYVNVEIPALDRFCDLIERGRVSVPPDVAAQTAVDPEPAPAPQKAPSEPPKPEPTNVSPATEAPAPDPKPAPTVTLDAVQRAAAELRDQGKLKAVTDLFPEFEIKKLSDLKGDKLPEFAGRLRQMGAKI